MARTKLLLPVAFGAEITKHSPWMFNVKGLSIPGKALISNLLSFIVLHLRMFRWRRFCLRIKGLPKCMWGSEDKLGKSRTWLWQKRGSTALLLGFNKSRVKLAVPGFLFPYAVAFYHELPSLASILKFSIWDRAIFEKFQIFPAKRQAPPEQQYILSIHLHPWY